jgi:hypothetical protein
MQSWRAARNTRALRSSCRIMRLHL